jgi:molecular chaperone GrpE
MAKSKQQKQPDDQLQKDSVDNQAELARQLAELTADLQRTRADFENYRKRVDGEKQSMRAMGESMAILRLLPVIDIFPPTPVITY